MLLWSEVRNDVGRVNDSARAARGGEPQSSNVCNSPIEIQPTEAEPENDTNQVIRILKSTDTYTDVLRGVRKTLSE